MDSRLRELRRAAGLTQAQLAATAGVSRPQVAAIEAGRHEPGVGAALALAGALGVAVTELFSADPLAPAAVLSSSDARPGALVRAARVGERLVFAPLADRGAGSFGFHAADGELADDRLELLPGADPRGFVAVGCEPSLELLAELLPARGMARLLAVHGTSAEAVAALVDGRCHAAVVHGRGRDLRPPRLPLRRFELGRWWTGLAFPTGAPVSLERVGAGRASVARRDPGAGTQRALERALRALGAGSRLSGPLASGHCDAARRAALRQAESALTIEPVARAYRLEFSPLERHRVEVWIAERWLEHPGARALLERLHSRAFSARLEQLGGYELGHTGRALA